MPENSRTGKTDRTYIYDGGNPVIIIQVQCIAGKHIRKVFLENLFMGNPNIIMISVISRKIFWQTEEVREYRHFIILLTRLR